MFLVIMMKSSSLSIWSPDGLQVISLQLLLSNAVCIINEVNFTYGIEITIFYWKIIYKLICKTELLVITWTCITTCRFSFSQKPLHKTWKLVTPKKLLSFQHNRHLYREINAAWVPIYLLPLIRSLIGIPLYFFFQICWNIDCWYAPRSLNIYMKKNDFLHTI